MQKRGLNSRKFTDQFVSELPEKFHQSDKAAAQSGFIRDCAAAFLLRRRTGLRLKMVCFFSELGTRNPEPATPSTFLSGIWNLIRNAHNNAVPGQKPGQVFCTPNAKPQTQTRFSESGTRNSEPAYFPTSLVSNSIEPSVTTAAHIAASAMKSAAAGRVEAPRRPARRPSTP
jgi:hypothetical protein